MAKTVYPLTSVRFIAASLVVFHHSARIFWPAFSARVDNGGPHEATGILSPAFSVATSFFFFLSGYVLSLVYLQEAQPIETRRFLAARFARLYPLYFVALVIDAPELIVPEIRLHGFALGLFKSAEIFAGNLLMLQVWKPNRLLRIDVPTWSLCVEAFFYLCFPIIGILLWKLRGARLWMVALALYVGGQLLVWALRPHLGLQTVLTLPPFHLSTFALGILMARWQKLHRQQQGPPARVWQVNLVLLMAACGLWISALLQPFFTMPAPYNDGLLAPLFAGVVWALSVVPSPLSQWLCREWWVKLGNASYALYLIHMPMLALFRHLRWVGQNVYPLYLTLCVALSLASFRYFETPARLWLTDRLQRRPNAAHLDLVSR